MKDFKPFLIHPKEINATASGVGLRPDDEPVAELFEVPEDESGVRVLVPSELGTFARLNVLVTLFGGDPDEWLGHIDSDDGATGVVEDVMFLQRVKALRARYPELRDRIRCLVHQTNTMLELIDGETN